MFEKFKLSFLVSPEGAAESLLTRQRAAGPPSRRQLEHTLLEFGSAALCGTNYFAEWRNVERQHAAKPFSELLRHTVEAENAGRAGARGQGRVVHS